MTASIFSIPETELGAALLASVPRKVVIWLDRLAVDLSVPGNFNRLSWDFSDPNDGWLTLSPEQSDREHESTTIRYTGDPTAPTSAVGNDPRFAAIELNLEFFTAFEARVYSELQFLEAIEIAKVEQDARYHNPPDED